ncbi:hypothetical protein [Poseidonocella sp. HB161398]|uniref:TsoY family (seleno)protein n=1 Tax=Poseidonocella sp. HB161398 TaxID=2320855 RepID=UPI001108B567|nr:hypothetical protein [Poseidonocella sp. HB161398]
MARSLSRAADRYSPLYFLASLGAGGLAVTFFMYLMFWVPHPGQPVPVFEDLAQVLATGPAWLRAATVIAASGIALLAVANLWLLFWNLARYRRFAAAPGFAAFRASNAETQILAMPLAIAMSVNAGFILGLVFVPGLWRVVEYLFPAALLAFGLTGWLALAQAGRFLRRVLTRPGSFDIEANGSFAQMMPAFAFAMVAVGFSAAAAMSQVPLTVGAALVGSTFFAMAAAIWAGAAAVIALPAMLRNGVAPESAPTLMVVIPILTVLGIMMIRQDHGLHATFDGHVAKVETLMMLSKILSAQILAGMAGLAVLRAQGYGARFLWGGTPSAGAFALICPGVALSVMLQFWIGKGLVATGLVARFSPAFWGLTGIALALQAAMLALMAYLAWQHFARHRPAVELPAE